MSTLTPYYSLILPSINDPTDQDLWGGMLNSNFETIDTVMHGFDEDLTRGFDSVPLGTIESGLWEFAPANRLQLIGQTLNRTDYQDLYDHLNLIGMIKTQSGKQSYEFGDGNGTTTFTMADYRNMYFRNYTSTRAIGTYQGDAIRNITGQSDGIRLSEYRGNIGSGAFRQYSGGTGQGAANNTIPMVGLSFDASLVVPTADENRTVNIGLMYTIKYTKAYFE